MENIPAQGITPQAISNDDVRLAVLQAVNGHERGMRGVAEKAEINYSGLWNQLNRGRGVLAYTIPKIVQATGDITPLGILCEAAGYVPVKLDSDHYRRQPGGIKKIRRDEVELSIIIGKNLEEIEKAIQDREITKQEYKSIHKHIRSAIRKLLEIDQKMKEAGGK